MKKMNRKILQGLLGIVEIIPKISVIIYSPVIQNTCMVTMNCINLCRMSMKAIL